MNGNILYRLAKDLSQLYASTRIKLIEDLFIKVAENVDFEIREWLVREIKIGKTKSTLQNPEILDAFLLLENLKQNYPAGIATSELMFHDKARPFIPILMAMREIASTVNPTILVPYRNILDATQNMKGLTGIGDSSSVRSDIEKLEKSFVEYENIRLNKPFEGESITTPPKKLSKNEQLRIRLTSLTVRFAEEISSAFSATGQLDLAGISENPDVLRDPAKIRDTMFPVGSKDEIPGSSFFILSKMAKEIIKDAPKYRYSFNFIRLSVLSSAGAISDDVLEQYVYQAHVALASGEEVLEEIPVIPVSNEVWSDSSVLMLLSITLYALSTKVT